MNRSLYMKFAYALLREQISTLLAKDPQQTEETKGMKAEGFDAQRMIDVVHRDGQLKLAFLDPS